MRRYLRQMACSLRPRSVGGVDLALRCFVAFLLETDSDVVSGASVRREHIEDYKPWLARRPGRASGSVTANTIRGLQELVVGAAGRSVSGQGVAAERSIPDGRSAAGDGAVMTGAADVIGVALAAAPDYPDGNRQLQREQVIWLWNTYSGAAHTYAWPLLLPTVGQDRRVPGDFFMVATTAHIAMLSLKTGSSPGAPTRRRRSRRGRSRLSRRDDSTLIHNQFRYVDRANMADAQV